MPDCAPLEFYNRFKLWNAIKKIEKAKNAQLTREIEVSIPKKLSSREGYYLVKELCYENFVNKGMIADIADLAPLYIGMINEMYVESRNDDVDYREVAPQEDFDRF